MAAIKFDFSGETAIVTGAASGIGAAVVGMMNKAGAKLTAIDRDNRRLDSALAEFSRHDVIGVEADITDPAEISAAVDRARDAFGAATMLVNCAAPLSPRAPVEHVSLTGWHEAIAASLTAPLLFAQAVIPEMRARRHGVIVNIGSTLGSVSIAGASIYCTTKAGLIALTRTMALDLATDGVRAVTVSPGAVMTNRLLLAHGTAEAANKVLAARHPIGRVGTVEEIAQAVMFAASPSMAFLTGSDLIVDGAYTAH